MIRISIFLLLTGLAMTICRCQFRSIADDEISLSSYRWALHQILGERISLSYYPEGVPLIKFSPEGDMEVHSGCQNLYGSFAVMGGKIRIDIDKVAIHRCPHEGEKDFLLALTYSNRFYLAKEKLFLLRDTTELIGFFPK